MSTTRARDLGKLMNHVQRARAGGPDDCRERVDGHVLDWRFAGRIDIGEHHFVGGAQRLRELGHQIARARVAVRLEHDQQPRPVARAAAITALISVGWCP